MIKAYTVDEVRKNIKEWKKQGLSIGFVPTMGYLHEGHGSLIERAAKENDKVVVSVFVNPIQFGPTEDLASYPRDFEADCAMCESLGADLVFHPENEEMYFEDFCTFVDINGLSEVLCGKTRPIHFRGVCTVVSKLFNIVTPGKAYFGQKDAQQLAIIRRMTRDLNFDVEIIGCPIIRDDDGLAKSSRNTYLSPMERKAAVVLSKAIFAGEKLAKEGVKDALTIKATMMAILKAEPLANVEYVELVDFNTLQDVETINGPILTAIAVRIGTTRLIDNFIIM